MSTTKENPPVPGPVIAYGTNARVQLLLAYRWPAALVMSSVVLAVALLKILSQPIPIRIDGGGLNVDRLVMPSTVTVRADGPLPVQAGVTVDGDSRVPGEQPIMIGGPVTVKAIQTPVKVAGSVGAQVQGQVTASVDSIQSAVQVTSERPLKVEGVVQVDEPVAVVGDVSVDGPVDVKGRVGIDGKVGTRIGF